LHYRPSHWGERAASGSRHACVLPGFAILVKFGDRHFCSPLLRGPKTTILGLEISVSAKFTTTRNTLHMDTFLHFVSVFGTLTGIFFGLTGLYFGLMALRNSNSIRGKELIGRMYAALIEDEVLYRKVRNRDTIEWEQDERQRLFVNKSLTLFDEMDYLLRPGLLQRVLKCCHSKAWEFVASEIQYFASNDSVWDYMVMRIEEGLDRGFPKDIIPFTGFPELLDEIPEMYQAKPPVRTPEKHKAFFDRLKTLR